MCQQCLLQRTLEKIQKVTLYVPSYSIGFFHQYLGNVSTSFVLILITSSFIVCLISEMKHLKPHGDWELFPFQAGIYLVKVSNRNTRTKYEICSKKQNDAILFRIRTEYGEILYLSVFSPNARKYGVVLVSLLLTFTPCLLAGLGSSKRWYFLCILGNILHDNKYLIVCKGVAAPLLFKAPTPWPSLPPF